MILHGTIHNDDFKRIMLCAKNRRCESPDSLHSKRFRLVSEQRKTGFGPALLLAPFFAQSLTLVRRSLLLNNTETLATQADHLKSPKAFQCKVIPVSACDPVLLQ